MKNILIRFLFGLIIIGMAACVPTEPPTLQGNGQSQTAPVHGLTPGVQEIKIGILAPLSGSVASFGKSTQNGAEQAMDEWNSRGGVLGMKIIPVLGDSQCDQNQAVNAANQLIHVQGVRYIVGDVCSGGSIGLAEIAEAQKIVQVSPTSTMDRLTLNADGSTRQYVFRACYTDSFQGSVAGKFAAVNLKDWRAFIMTDPEDDYTVGLANAFEKGFVQNGGTIVGKAEYSHKDTDFSVILAQIMTAQPEIVYIGDAYTQVNALVGQARQKGIQIPFLGGDGWDSPDLDRVAAGGSYYTTHFSLADQRPIVQEWVKKYQELYQKTPDSLAVLGYDATNLVLSAIAQAGVDDTSKVAQALTGIKWDGVSGTIQFDQKHNPIKPVVVMQVKKGEDQYITTVNP